jgi:dihydrofolate reductase
MGKIVVSENVSVDGVVEDPTGEEGSARGGWFLRMTDADREAFAAVELAEAQDASALLHGRRTDASFGARWTSRTGAWADRLNGLPKYVVSSTLSEPRWSPATVLAGEVVAEVSALRRRVEGDIVVYASIRLVRTLLEHDLVDELRLIVHPVVVGAGERLVAGTDRARPWCLVDTRAVGTGLALLTYRPDRTAGDDELSHSSPPVST